MRRLCSAFVGSVLIAGLTVMVAAPASSAPPWLPDVEATVGPMEFVRETATAIAPDGTFVVAWVQNVDGGDANWSVQVATRAPGAAEFDAPVEAAPPGFNLRGLALVVDATGATTAAWVRQVGRRDVVEAARRTAGAEDFAGPETVTDPQSSVGNIDGVGDEHGRVTLIWEGSTSNAGEVTSRVDWATWEPTKPGWVDAQTLASGNVDSADLAVDGAGAVTVAWVQVRANDSLVQTRTRLAGSSGFEPVETHSPAGATAESPDLAANGSRETVLAWSLTGATNSGVKVAVRAAGAASFGGPIDVAATPDVRQPVVAIDDAGAITVAWSEFDEVPQVWVATAPAGGAFRPPVLVSSGGERLPRIFLSSSAAGAAVLVWIHYWDASIDHRVVRSAYRPAGGAFGDPVDLTAPAAGVFDDEVAASVDEAGHALVAWARITKAEDFLDRAHARILDATAPALDAVAVPATGTTGATLSMTASASDRWSGPPSIIWDFGDGRSATGASTSHVYAAAGSYVVRVTATDAVGNARSLTRTITVTDATAPVLSGARLRPGLLPTGEGATLKVTSSERAALAGVVQRRRDGAWRTVGTKRWSVAAGANTRTFYGKTSEQRLRTGRYRVRLTATDPAGNASATTTIRFASTAAEKKKAMRRFCSAFVGSVLISGLAVLVAAPVSAATPWLPEVEATAGAAEGVREIATATAPDGSLVMAWAQNLDGGTSSWSVQVAVRAPGAGEFAAPVEVAPPGDNVAEVVVVVDPTGATTIAWIRGSATSAVVMAARRSAEASVFVGPETVTPPGSVPLSVAGVGDEQGRVTLVWDDYFTADGGGFRVGSATWEPAIADWSDAEPLAAGRVGASDLAVDGAGAVTVTWMSVTSGPEAVQTRTRPAGSNVFDAVQTHSPASARAWAPDVASNAAGATVLAWSQTGVSNSTVQVAVRAAGSDSFAPPGTVTTAAVPPITSVTIAGDGTVTVAWSEFDPVPRVLVATARAGGAFTAPVEVASGGESLPSLSLASSASGAAVLAWIHQWDDSNGARVARAAYRPAGGEFGDPVDLTAPAPGVFDDEVAASVDAAGHGFVGWARTSQDEDVPRRAHARVVDGIAPRLDAVDVSSTGTAGAALTMSVTATERWAGPATIAWDFGDGTSATGGSATHVYAAAGSYVVRVTATDAVGNASTVTRAVTVAAAVTDATAPVLSGARLRPGLLPTGHGSRLKVSSSERASLTGVVQRKRGGAWRAVGSKRWSVSAGANTRTFYGKTPEQRLRSGRYRVRLTATDAAGNASAATAIRFRVDRR